MAKTPAPKYLFVRYVDKGRKVSVGEYLRAKWRNVVPAFKLDDKAAVIELDALIQLFIKRENREVLLVNYQGSGAAEALNKEMQKYR